MPEDLDFEAERSRLLRILRRQGIEDANVLGAMARVPREEFLPPEIVERAYDNQALSIGLGQTISQPYIVAVMTQALGLRGSERILEVGTGSGYQAAVLATLAKEVYTIERLPELAARAKQTLDRLGFSNIHYRIGDGTEGWPEEAPFDGILVTAAAPDVTDTLVAQLEEGGKLVTPVGDADRQVLQCFQRVGAELKRTRICECRFVPLIGAHGFQR